VVFPTFTPDNDIKVYSISTYHQNESEGTIVNTISVYDDEELIGTWEAVNLSGKYDVPEEEWFCYPRGLVLEAGHNYKFVDSDPETWSYNTESDGCGFIKITTGSETIKGLTPEVSKMGEKVEFNGHTYQRIDAPCEWEEAKYYCERHGGYLATITSAEEQAAIEELLQGGTMDVYWLGGTAYDCTLEWVSGEDTSYTNWAAGQPDNALEGYHVEIQNKEMEYLPIYKWGDTDAAGKFFGLDKTGFICEWGEVDKSEGLKGSGTQTDPYQLSTLEEYKKFVSMVNSGKKPDACAVLTADISGVTEMVGTLEHKYLGSGDWVGNPYSGTFDGNGYTIDVNINGSAGYEAPFCSLKGATIRNLRVTGSVTGGMHCSGIAGLMWGGSENLIENCIVEAAVTTKESHCGGIVGHAYDSYTTVRNCLFAGELKGASSTACGIYGWCHLGGTHTVENCLENGTYTDCSGVDPMGHGTGVTVSIVNSYKYTDAGSKGELVGEMSPEEIASALGSGWKVEDKKAVPVIAKASALLFGDPNNDGKIDAKDASMILIEYSKMSTGGESSLSDEQKAAANVNGDDKIDAKDASAVLSYYAMASTATGDVPSMEEFMSSRAS
jgi:hypothetical protein